MKKGNYKGRKKGQISNRRKIMGEIKWAKYQKERIKKIKHWRKANIKRKLIEYKGGKCNKCGYSKSYLSVYCFHHKNPKEKDFGISGVKWNYNRMIKEVDKCLLLCHNCHNELHEDEWNKKRENKDKLYT
jgi:hypothetical protein